MIKHAAMITLREDSSTLQAPPEEKENLRPEAIIWIQAANLTTGVVY